MLALEPLTSHAPLLCLAQCPSGRESNILGLGTYHLANCHADLAMDAVNQNAYMLRPIANVEMVAPANASAHTDPTFFRNLHSSSDIVPAVLG